MKLRSIINDKLASSYPVFYLLLIIGITAFLYLLCSSFLEFFLNYMRRDGSPVKDTYTVTFFDMWWAHGGILLFILLVGVFSFLMYMHMSNYQYGGRFRQ